MDKISGATTTIDEASSAQKAEDQKNKSLVELQNLKSDLTNFVVTKDHKLMPIPENSTDSAVLFSFLASALGDLTLAKLKASTKKTGHAIGLIARKTTKEELDELDPKDFKSATFIANLDDLPRKSYQSMTTDYLICWDKGSYEADGHIIVVHTDKKKRRLRVEKKDKAEYFVEKRGNSDKVLTKTELITMKELVEKQDGWSTQQI